MAKYLVANLAGVDRVAVHSALLFHLALGFEELPIFFAFECFGSSMDVLYVPHLVVFRRE